MFDLAPHSFSLYHSALKSAEWRREENGREECNSSLGPAAFPVFFFTEQVARNASQTFFIQLSFPAVRIKNKIKKKPNQKQKTNKHKKPQKFWRGRTVLQVVYFLVHLLQFFMTNAQIHLDLNHRRSSVWNMLYTNISVTLVCNYFQKVKIHQNQCRRLWLEVYFAITLSTCWVSWPAIWMQTTHTVLKLGRKCVSVDVGT